MQLINNNFGNKFKSNLIGVIIGFGALIIASAAYAQGCTMACPPPPPANSCNNLFESCPAARTPNLVQTLAAPVTSAIDINGTSVIVNPPPTNGSPAVVTASDITSTSTGIGNNISASSTNGVMLDVVSQQDLSGAISSTNNIVATAAVPGAIVQTTSAYGNTSQGQACCGGMDVIANQNVAVGTGSIDAHGTLNSSSNVGTLSMTTNANANIMAGAAINGPISLVANQNNYATTRATSDSNICCNTTTSSVSAITTANSSQSSSETSTVYSWAVQNNYGNVDAAANQIANGMRDSSTAAQATGNVASSYNKWGYTQLSASQYLEGDVSSYAQSKNTYFYGNVTAGTTSQGNLAIVSSTGSDGRLTAYQDISSLSGIFATTDWIGASADGGVGSAIASAAGNSLTGFACTTCGQAGVALFGDVNQTNNGNVTATVNMSGSSSGHLTASGMAVGNSANFITQSGLN